MQVLAISFLIVSALLAGCASVSPPAGTALRTEEFRIASPAPGIELYVRNKAPASMSRFSGEKTVLFVHGATYPAETSFDLQLDGLSWMDYIARHGYDVYLVNVRGYGRSTRPPSMSRPPRGHVLMQLRWWTRMAGLDAIGLPVGGSRAAAGRPAPPSPSSRPAVTRRRR